MPVILAVALFALLLSGCAGYRLGPTNDVDAGARSIAVISFANETAEPRLISAVNQALRDAFLRDGTYRLARAGESDLVVSGRILNYDRGALSFEPNDLLTTRDFRIQMTAFFEVRDRSGDVLLARTATGQSYLRAGQDLVSAERQNLPVLAEDLARVISDAIVDGAWWPDAELPAELQPLPGTSPAGFYPRR